MNLTATIMGKKDKTYQRFIIYVACDMGAFREFLHLFSSRLRSKKDVSGYDFDYDEGKLEQMETKF